MSPDIINTIKRLAHEQREEVISWRRWMHQHPELSQEEFHTMEYIAERLRGMGLEPRTGIGGTGVMAMIHGAAGHTPQSPRDSYCVALRADFDALAGMYGMNSTGAIGNSTGATGPHTGEPDPGGADTVTTDGDMTDALS